MALVQSRPGQPGGDASAAIQALVDLIAEAQASIPEAVVAARGQHYSWDHIAGLLSISRAVTIRRYSRYCQPGAERMTLDDRAPQ